MKKFGFATIAATGLAAAIVGLAAPAQAVPALNVPTVSASRSMSRAALTISSWLNDIHQRADRPAGGHRRAAEPLSTYTTKGHPQRVPLFVASSAYPAAVWLLQVRVPA